MGLDMYLKSYVHLYCEQGKLPITLMLNDREFTIDKNDVVIKELAYWRKANAIHKWFVDNCGGGGDYCQEMYVSEDKLKGLRDLCERVMANKNLASELLPTESGCFFGSLEYDDYYFECIEYTIKVINDIINNPNVSHVYYQASW